MTAEQSAVTEVALPLSRVASGKVREIFQLDEGRLLFAATDRISAYDVVMAQGIPDKGKVLTGMSVFWLDLLRDVCPNHLVSHAVADLPGQLSAHLDLLGGRFMIVRRLKMLPVEFVVRGYLAGSGWRDYRRFGSVCGVSLPPGLREADRLPEVVFTPATKATSGHDENIGEDEAAALCGADRIKAAREYSIELYSVAAAYAERRGIILADTKFEFGLDDGDVVLADEVLTPDSSRFWPADRWVPGTAPPSLDKQFVRDWLDEAGWDRNPPPPDLAAGVVDQTRRTYVEAYERLTGTAFSSWSGS